MRYSPSTLGFYPSDKEESQPYIEAGTLPDDLIEISDDDYHIWLNPPPGYYSFFDETGPGVRELPGRDYISEAENKRGQLLSDVRAATYTINAKLLMSRELSEEEKKKFNAWIDYSDELMSIDLSNAPEINWPQKPE